MRKLQNMKKLLLIIAIVFTANTFAQKEREVGEFNEIKVYDRIDVKMVKSNSNKVVIYGEDLSDIEIVNKNGVLKIRTDIEKTLQGDENYVVVYYTGVAIIDGNEGAFISTEDVIEQQSIQLRSQEGARLDIKLNVTDLIAKAVTGGGIKVTGTSKNQDISLNTGGIYEGRGLQTEDTAISIKAAGEAEVFATQKVDAKVRAGGNIKVYGNPTTLNKDTALGGRITRVD